MRKQLIVLAIAVGLVILAIFQPKGGNKEPAPKVGFQAPEFSITGFDEKSHSLAQLNGKPVLINFWASWCGPCREEAPELVRLYNKYKGNIEFYAVNATKDDTLNGARSFVDEFNFPFPVLLDKEGKVSDLYRIKSYPTTFFVDGEGRITKINLGIVAPEALEQTIVQTITHSIGKPKGGI